MKARVATQGRNRALDGFRAVAVMAVIGEHTGHLDGGYYGVDLFFVISGFLITTMLRREIASTGRVRRLRFLRRRMTRLLPALAVAVGVYLMMAGIGWAPMHATVVGSLEALTYTTNVLGDWTLPSLLGFTWSLGLEEQFYIVWPFVLLAMRGLALRRQAQVLAMFAVSSLLRAIASVTLAQHPRTPGVLYHTHFEPLLIGAALALAVEAGVNLRRLVGIGQILVAGGALIVLASVPTLSPLDLRPGFLFGFAVAAAAGVVLIVNAIAGHPALSLFSRPAIAYVGLVSYGIYLYHLAVITALKRAGIDGFALTAAAAVGATATAAVSYQLIETRFHQLRSVLTANPANT